MNIYNFINEHYKQQNYDLLLKDNHRKLKNISFEYIIYAIVNCIHPGLKTNAIPEDQINNIKLFGNVCEHLLSFTSDNIISFFTEPIKLKRSYCPHEVFIIVDEVCNRSDSDLSLFQARAIS